MIGHLLTQSATWRKRTGTDAYGAATYATDVTISCRWEWKRRLVRSAAGQEIVSEGRVYVTASVAAGDQLVDPLGRSWTVLASNPQYGLGGAEQYREVSI